MWCSKILFRKNNIHNVSRRGFITGKLSFSAKWLREKSLCAHMLSSQFYFKKGVGAASTVSTIETLIKLFIRHISELFVQSQQYVIWIPIEVHAICYP